MKDRVPEDEILGGIRNHDSEILRHVYQTCFPLIEGFVIHHHGSREEAKDVFQEAILIAYRKIRSGELDLTCRFSTYLYAVGKNIWLQERRKQLLHAEKLREQPLAVNEPDPEEDPLLRKHMTELFMKHFRELSRDCQKILLMAFNHRSVEEIRDAMDYKDLHHAADRKYRCKKSLIKRILNDPLFKRLKNEPR